MFIGNVKHDTTITKIKLSCVSFAPHSRIFSVVGSLISTARDSQNDSPKLIMNSVFLTTLRFHESVAVIIRCTDFCGLSNWRHLVRRGLKVRVYRRFCGRKSGYKRKKRKKRGIDVYVRNSLRPGPL